MLRFILALSLIASAAIAADKPNVIFILADDLGFGDVSCNGATRVQTPHIDRIAKEGIRFTDAHCTSATCTPSRYSAITGQYAWRKAGTGILPGDAALVIDLDRLTLPKMFQQAGYKTGAVGKWHLGLGKGPGKTNWNEEITPGPREVGFDYSFIIPATGDRTPCVYVENQRIVGLETDDPIHVSYDVQNPAGNDPTGKDHPELLKVHPSHGHDQTIVNGVSRIGTMSGGKAARWIDEDMSDTVGTKAVQFIEEHKDGPFYLYFATHNIHVPRVPHPRYVGKTEMGPRGDSIVELDAQVGMVLEALDRLKIAENTLVILTSDNGPVIDDGYVDQAWELLGNHKAAGPYRGNKGSNFEAGTRVPFVLRWPARVKPGESDALVSQVDFLASFANLVGTTIPKGQAPDSVDVLSALLGESSVGRSEYIEQGTNLMGLRQGNWKYVVPGRGVMIRETTGSEVGSEPEGMLFDLSKDPGERNNLIQTEKERAVAMHDRLGELGGLTPEPAQPWKTGQKGGKGKANVKAKADKGNAEKSKANK